MSSKIAMLYDTVYSKICGSGVNLNLFHFQYLAVYQLNKDLKNVLSKVDAMNVLDFGCGQKPYKSWFKSTQAYIGVDVYQNGSVDVVVDGNESLPFSNEDFDFVLSSQVFEHVENMNNISEIHRVLKSTGVFLISVPFLYHIHDEHDYRRFTHKGLYDLLKKEGFESIKITKQGGIGSTIGLLFLSFLDSSMNKNKVTRITKGLSLPFWLLFTFVLNSCMYVLDKIDSTESYYNNLLAVCSKR